MGQKGKFKLIKLNYNHIWKNNFVTKDKKIYSKNYFKIFLLKNYIKFFFLYPISKQFGFSQKITSQKLYISQIWIHSYNNFIIISFNIKYRNKKFYYKNLLDNYIRLKYSNNFINKKYFF